MFLILSGTLIPVGLDAAPAKKAAAEKKTAAEKKAPAEKKLSSIDSATDTKYDQMCEERRQKIAGVIAEFIAKRKDISKPNVVEEIEGKIKQFMPVVPAKEVQAKSLQELNDEAEDLTNKKYNQKFEEDLLEKAAQLAEKRYPLAEKNTKVKITYRQGPFEYNVSGTYYGSDSRTLQINDKKISLVDLSKEQRLLYDVKFNQEFRTKYINEVKARYEQKRLKEKQKFFETLLISQGEENVKRGYIYNKQTETWITAREQAKRIIEQEIRKIRAAQEKQQKEALAKAAGQQGDAAQQAGDGDQTGAETVDPKVYEDTLANAKKRQVEISRNFSGIDAYQGFRMAFWDASRSEVAILFSQDSNVVFTKNISFDVLEIKNPAPLQPKKVIFYYNSRLNKTVEYFPTLSGEDFGKLQKAYHENYGSTLEEKETGRDLFEEIDAEKLTPEDLRGKDQPAEKGLENAYVFHWNGKYTKASFSFEYDKNKDEYVSIVFSKEYFPLGIKQ